MQKKLLCFIAMAFDRKDTDKLYEKAIKPVLTRNNVVPMIINRRETNIDINIQIIDQLNKCDFCIADLTYARPSVYFEAGYAQCKREVIYTVRKDHLKKDQPENQRVHFDLQMKPLITWQSPIDISFRKKLERRLRHTVLKKLERKSKDSERLKHEKQKFVSMPLNKKLELIRKISISSILRRTFKQWRILGAPYRSSYYSMFHDKIYRNPIAYCKFDLSFLAMRRKGTVLDIISITAVEKANLKYLRDIIGERFLSSSGMFWSLDRKGILNNIRATKEHHIILSLGATLSSRIMSAMPNLHYSHQFNRYEATDTSTYKAGEHGRRINRAIHLYFPSNIDSEATIKARLSQILSYVKN